MHITVLKKETIDFLEIKKNGVYFDCTFGGGGHSREMLERCDEITLFCIDRDMSVYPNFEKLKADFPKANLKFINEKFGNLKTIIQNLQPIKIDGIAFDFGVSSMQIDSPDRGFSFQKDGNLSMEMGLCKISAHEFINSIDEESLANIIYKYGDERKSRIIAKAIVKARQNEEIKTTVQLANIVKAAARRYNDTIHPATRTFQAIRIYINDELLEIENAINAVYFAAHEGLHVSCISFHSLEDLIIKDFIKSHDKQNLEKDDFDKNYSNFVQKEQKICTNLPFFVKKLHNGVIAPSKDEISQNIRSRSAKLRAFSFTKNENFID
ncbi:16S rRNA (cytosine(1402)-N(4))-methyltransferase RsmH [Candidatus Deianiraea vastatrix]|uniref:Ribosomal RNA small subunit methyltransferase H n=1 Tax=Candidatus Deianiraea vastatrix TaxID=2163644 RepID=A0A5B8XCT6_9RICK|nr:16S rRNA (cytosine(1402)-N(4))-methyltransferase RsmH [Candidatus Deianiraea vastatrix]QED23168.1 Ribosomal RNA small subunit methyltransferase H [Candidatus Deianiraea vastatrix]